MDWYCKNNVKNSDKEIIFIEGNYYFEKDREGDNICLTSEFGNDIFLNKEIIKYSFIQVY